MATKKTTKSAANTAKPRKKRGIGPALRKEAMLRELIKSHGRVGVAAKAVGIERSTFSAWVREDPDFAQRVEAMEESVNDWYEDQFKALVAEKNPQAIIHAAKTRLRSRGYGEKVEVEAKVIGAGAFVAALKSLEDAPAPHEDANA